MKVKKLISLILSVIMILPLLPSSALAEDVWSRQEYYAQSIQNFSEYDYSDPMHITDEEFFGVWDCENWEKTPYFDYETYPGMEKVKDAAKNGEYEKCKDELLNYYKARYATFNITNTVSKSPSHKTLTGYETLFDNFFPSNNQAVSGRMIVEKSPEPKWVSMDFTDDVKSAAKATSKKKIFQFAASNRDGYTALIDSIESGNGAYVEVLVNGAYKTFHATKDNYVQINNQEDNFYDAQTLLVEESVSAIGTNPLRPTDSYTKTAYMEFDFIGLTADDKIENARLYIHATMQESNCPAGVRKPSDVKSLYVLPYTKDVALDLDTLTYNKFSTYSATYRSFDGEKFQWLDADREAGIIDTKKNGGAIFAVRGFLMSAYSGYLATGDETFAYHIIRTILSCIQEGGTMEEKIRYHDNENFDLNMSFNTMQIFLSLPSYMKFLIESEHMNPEAFTMIMKFFWESAEVLVNTWYSGEEANNWGGYNCNGLQYAYIFFPEFCSASLPLIDTPRDERYPGSVTGGWAAVEKYRRAYKALDDFYEDGTAVERSTSYTFDGLETLLNVVDVAEVVGDIDTESLFTEEMLDRIEKAGIYLINHMNPRFGDWQVGDANPYNADFTKNIKRIIKLVKDNPYLEYVATSRKLGQKPPWLTVVGDRISKVTFRNSWEENAVAGHLENAGGTGSHGHNDDLSLTVAAYGNYLLVDPLMGKYDVSEPMERWVSSTRGHNTIEINDTIGTGSKYYHEGDADLFGDTMIVPLRQYNHLNGDLHPENREINTIYDFIRGESFAYTDHNRMEYDYKVLRDVLFLHNGYFIVTDYIEPENPEGINKYKQLWHFKPNAEIFVDRETNTIRTNFDGDANIVVATVKTDNVKYPEIKDGLYANIKENFQNAKYAFFEQNSAGISTFNTLLYPTAIGDKPRVTTKKIALNIPQTKANAFSADVYNEENGAFKTVSYYSLFDTSLLAERDFGAYSTDAEVALAERTQDEYSTAIIRNGKQLKNTEDDLYIVYSTQSLADIGIEWKENSVYIATSKTEGENAIDLKNVTVYSKKPADAVYLNGKSVSFSQQGRYIYFAAAPIIDDSAYVEEVTPDTEGNTPIHGAGTNDTPSSGGGGGGGGGSADTDADTKTDEVITPTEDTGKFSAELDNHWAEKEISALINSKVITGDDKGKLNLSENITRAEFITMLIRAIKLEEKSYTGKFKDVSQENWYAGFIETAFANKLIEGDNGFMHPDRKITREEMTKIVTLACKDAEIKTNGTKAFSDEAAISEWAKEYVQAAVGMGLVNGMENGEFRPKETAKREQAMVIIYRLMNLQK